MISSDPLSTKFANQMTVAGVRKVMGENAPAQPAVCFEKLHFPTSLLGAVCSSKPSQAASDDNAPSMAASSRLFA